MENQEQLLESKELRDQLASKVEVLEKVKELLLIPSTDFATVKQVADFYEVTEKVIEQVYITHKDELLSDGMSLKKYSDFLNLDNLGIKKMQGKSIMKLTNEDELVIPNRGLKVFPRRAILRIGMLLRDSKVAKEVRTQLLNIEEKTSNEVKTQDIDEEQKIMLEVGMAYGSGNPDTIMLATAKYMDFKNRHIKQQEQHIKQQEQHIEQLQQDNKALTGEILKWEDRSKINFAVRKLAMMVHKPTGCTWNDLYKELLYKHHINVKLRGDKPWIQHVKEDEWNNVVKSFSAICEENNISPSDILNNLQED